MLKAPLLAECVSRAIQFFPRTAAASCPLCRAPIRDRRGDWAGAGRGEGRKSCDQGAAHGAVEGPPLQFSDPRSRQIEVPGILISRGRIFLRPLNLDAITPANDAICRHNGSDQVHSTVALACHSTFRSKLDLMPNSEIPANRRHRHSLSAAHLGIASRTVRPAGEACTTNGCRDQSPARSGRDHRRQARGRREGGGGEG